MVWRRNAFSNCNSSDNDTDTDHAKEPQALGYNYSYQVFRMFALFTTLTEFMCGQSICRASINMNINVTAELAVDGRPAGSGDLLLSSASQDPFFERTSNPWPRPIKLTLVEKKGILTIPLIYVR